MDGKRESSTNLTKIGVKAILAGFHRFVKAPAEIRADLEAHPNGAVQRLHAIVKEMEAGMHPRRVWQRDAAVQVMEVLLWVYAMDTAYRSQGDWMLERLLAAAHDIRPHLDPRPPEEWYINLMEGDEHGDLDNGRLMVRFGAYLKKRLS